MHARSMARGLFTAARIRSIVSERTMGEGRGWPNGRGAFPPTADAPHLADDSGWDGSEQASCREASVSVSWAELRPSVVDRWAQSAGLGQVARFAGVGVLSTIAHLSLFALFQTILESSQVANVASLVIATVLNTSLNRRWTFGVRVRVGWESTMCRHLQSSCSPGSVVSGADASARRRCRPRTPIAGSKHPAR